MTYYKSCLGISGAYNTWCNKIQSLTGISGPPHTQIWVHTQNIRLTIVGVPVWQRGENYGTENRIICRRSSSQKYTFWFQDIFILQIPLAHYVSPFKLPHFPLYAPFLSFQSRVPQSGHAQPSWLFSPFILVGTFPMAGTQSHLSCAALTLLPYVHKAPEQLPACCPQLLPASRCSQCSHSPVGSGQAPDLSPGCSICCWPAAALVLQAGVSQCLHRGSVTCWTCSARLLFESAQNF